MLTDRRIRILAIGGTHAKKNEKKAVQWYQKGSLLYWFVMSRGFAWLIGRDGRVFEWTGNLAGHQFWRRFVSFFTRQQWVPSLLDWEILGACIHDHLCPTLVPSEHWMPGCDTHLWLHSHAGNGGFFACAKGLKVNTFVTFCTPVRVDMVDTIKDARPNIGFWIHVYSDRSDLIQIAGSAGDGELHPRLRKFSDLPDEYGQTLGQLGLGPDLEIFVDDGHSNILNDPTKFDRLEPILALMEQRHGRPDFLARA